jgi:fructose-bisphosphate aldolase class II
LTIDQEILMPIATPEIYGQMLDRAKAGAFAYPAINVSSSQTLIGAIRGFAEAESDGIIQISWGGAEYLSGSTVKNMLDGAVALAEFAHVVAKNYNVNIGIHTDHCPAEKLDGFMRPLLDFGAERINSGKAPLFNSHMWDGSAVDMPENMKIAEELLEKSRAAHTILEIEIGVVGGEEDGIEAKHDAKLYSTPEDALLTVATLGTDPTARYMVAATFGNVHGVYKPGNVVLQPKILKTLQDAVAEKLALPAGSKPMDLVFHGGSGSLLSEIRESLDYGVIKMNIDTDTQYAFTRPVVDHMFKNYDGVLKVEGEVGNKKAYDPRAWGKVAEAGLAKRVVEACEDLRSTGTTLNK